MDEKTRELVVSFQRRAMDAAENRHTWHQQDVGHVADLCHALKEQDAEIARLRGIIAEANADEEDRRLEREASDREGCS